MPASVDWHPDYDGNVLLMEIASPVTLDEVLDVTQRESDLVQEATAVVHTLIDLTENTGVPQHLLSNFPKIARMPAVTHPNSGLKVVVGASGIAETMLGIFSSVYRTVHLAESITEAHQIIQEQNDKHVQPE